MYFIYKDARLKWLEDKGYQHPKDGAWVEDHRLCLRGWMEQDPEKRRQWAVLMNMIDDFWPRLETNKMELGDEVIFE